jgi:hypothetical protein
VIPADLDYRHLMPCWIEVPAVVFHRDGDPCTYCGRPAVVVVRQVVAGRPLGHLVLRCEAHRLGERQVEYAAAHYADHQAHQEAPR